jgi:hypothetical protein
MRPAPTPSLAGSAGCERFRSFCRLAATLGRRPNAFLANRHLTKWPLELPVAPKEDEDARNDDPDQDQDDQSLRRLILIATVKSGCSAV